MTPEQRINQILHRPGGANAGFVVDVLKYNNGTYALRVYADQIRRASEQHAAEFIVWLQESLELIRNAGIICWLEKGRAVE